MTFRFSFPRCTQGAAGRWLLLASLLVAGHRAAACDMCGCFMGLTPYDNQSSLALLTRYRVFHGYGGQPHTLFPAGAPVVGLRQAAPEANTLPVVGTAQRVQHDHNPGMVMPNSPDDYEVFRVAELRARYFLSRRIELNAYLPYALTDARLMGETTSTRGIGDVTLFAGYHLVRRVEVEGPQQRLIVGGGVKLPTGANDRRDAAGNRYESMVQPGSGTTDAFAYANYIVAYRRVGLSLNGSLKLTGENHYRESAAPATTQFANLFYVVPLGADWKVIPSAQLYYEYTKGQKTDGELTGEHRMNNALLGPGLDVYFKNIALNTAVQLPVYNHGAPDHPASAGRVVLGLTYSFKQTTYLLGKQL